MARKFILILCLFFSFSSEAKKSLSPGVNIPKSDSLEINILKNQVVDLNNKISVLNNDVKSKIDNQNSTIQTSFSGVSNQISAASIFLAIFSVVMTVIAIFVGLYVSRVQKNIHSILETNEKIKTEVDSVNAMIQTDMTSLYLKLQTEETRSLINRLKHVPRDIINIMPLLLSRNIPASEYNNLKQGYLRLRTDNSPNLIGHDFEGQYVVLFFQHFAGTAYNDPEIEKYLESGFQHLIDNSFENDIVKSTTDIFKEYVVGTIDIKKINFFLSILAQSSYAGFKDLYEAIFEQLISKNRQFDFYSKIENSPNSTIVKKMYGKVLKEKYNSNPTNTMEQNNILNDIQE